MFKCKSKNTVNASDKKLSRFYQFILLSILLHRNIWEDVTSGYNRSVDINFCGFNWDSILELPELLELTPEETKKTEEVIRKQAQIHELLKEKYAEFKSQAPEVPDTLKKNVELLADTFGLSETEKDILIFLVIANFREFNCLTLLNIVRAKNTGPRSYRDILAEFLSTVCDSDIEAIRKALSMNSPLVQNKLICIDDDPRTFEHYAALRDDLGDKLLNVGTDIEELLQKSLIKAPEPTLMIEDFSYLNPKLPLLVKYLEKARQSNQCGVNILLYGPPGTGKSELSRVIGNVIGAEVFEVPVADADGDIINDRMASLMFNLTQLKGNSSALLVFDEAQDLFKNFNSMPFLSNTISRHEKGAQNKGMTNKMLESNQTPVLWITNSIDAMDPAYIRRFDFCLEVPVPPEEQRIKILQMKAGNLLFPEGIRCIARRSDIAPALIDRTAKVISTISTTKDELQKHFFTHLNASLSSMGLRTVTLSEKLNLDDLYDPQLSTADINLKDIAQGIAQSQAARLCLYGVPGTGKTAWARFLGRELNKKVLVKRCSDLFDCFVGMTEKNIAAAFEEAKSEEAILVLDEADSFLQKRSGAFHSWEVTQVNEMLTQIENFDGIFVATTNHLESMDEACLRRFDLKVKFDYLNSDKAFELFKRYAQRLCPETEIDSQILSEVAKLRFLAPGDFATVANQSRFNPVRSPSELFLRLEKECQTKNAHSHKRPIGFS